MLAELMSTVANYQKLRKQQLKVRENEGEVDSEGREKDKE
jgi:hypothetical protein